MYNFLKHVFNMKNLPSGNTSELLKTLVKLSPKSFTDTLTRANKEQGVHSLKLLEYIKSHLK